MQLKLGGTRGDTGEMGGFSQVVFCEIGGLSCPKFRTVKALSTGVMGSFSEAVSMAYHMTQKTMVYRENGKQENDIQKNTLQGF